MITENLNDLLDPNRKLKPAPDRVFKAVPTDGRGGSVAFSNMDEAFDYAMQRGSMRVEVLDVELNLETLIHAINGFSGLGQLVKVVHPPR